MLNKLEKWFASYFCQKQINLSIVIKTVDNPGFFVKIHLPDRYASYSFQKIKEDLSENNWIICNLREGNFESGCSIFNLQKALYIFLSFVNEIKNEDFDPQEISGLQFLQEWYFMHCDGDWEHCYGVELKTIDPPGWELEIQLIGTELENYEFEEIKEERSPSDHFHCFIEDETSTFRGYGGLCNTEEMLTIFQKWAEKCYAELWQEIFKELRDIKPKENTSILDTLQRWYALQCNGIWERQHGISIQPLDRAGFSITIDLADTEYENAPFEPVQEQHSSSDWFFCSIQNKVFYAECSIANLEKPLSLFLAFANQNSARDSFFPSTVKDEALQFLQRWYLAHCNGDWEKRFGPVLCTTYNRPGWMVEVDFSKTELAECQFYDFKRVDSLDNHAYCFGEKGIFKGIGGLFNMHELLDYFQGWVILQDPNNVK